MKLPFGRKRTETHVHNEDHVGKPATAKGRTLLLLSQVLAALSIACLVVGVALLQHHLNDRREGILDRASEPGSFKDIMQSAHYTPYFGSSGRQWQLLWWIIAGSALVWLMTVLLVIRAARIVQWHAALIGLHIYFLVLCTFAIDSFLWINHYNNVRGFFGKSYVATTLAGLFGIAVADGLAVLALGMISSTRHIDSRRVQEDHSRHDRVHHDHEHHTVAPAAVPREPVATQHTTPQTFAGEAQPVKVHMGDTIPQRY